MIGFISTDILSDIADAIREKTGSSAKLSPSQMAAQIQEISGSGLFKPADVPDYVTKEAFDVIRRVRSVQTEKTFTTLVWSDAHHAGEQSTSWAQQTNIGSLHAAMGAAAIANGCKIDACVFGGDFTFGNGATTLELFRQQTKELNRYMDAGFGGFPSLYCIGNHDTGEYYQRDGGGDLYGADVLYELIGKRNEACMGAVAGSQKWDYCYKDFQDKKIRLIILDTVEGEITDGYTGGQCSDAQLLWFAQRLYEVGNQADWGIIVAGHYPLDYGGTSSAGNIVYQYVIGGSVTIAGTTVQFLGHNSAKFVANYHGHTHCLKAAKTNHISGGAGVEFDAWRLATPSGSFYRNNEYAGQLVNGIDFGETQTYQKTAGTGKDTAFVVNVYDPDKAMIFSICYGAGYDRSVSIGSTLYYTISTNLTHCVIDNDQAYVEDDAGYSANITAESGYDLDSVRMFIGGEETTQYHVTVTGNTARISCGGVTGNIVITAVASRHVNYHNVVDDALDVNGGSYPFHDGYSLSSAGAETSYASFTVTGFIPLENNNTAHVYRIGGTGITWSASEEYCRVAWYDASHALLKEVLPAKRFDSSVYYPSTISEANTAVTFKVTNSQGQIVNNVPASAAYFRAAVRGNGADLIITLDEEID